MLVTNPASPTYLPPVPDQRSHSAAALAAREGQPAQDQLRFDELTANRGELGISGPGSPPPQQHRKACGHHDKKRGGHATP